MSPDAGRVLDKATGVNSLVQWSLSSTESGKNRWPGAGSPGTRRSGNRFLWTAGQSSPLLWGGIAHSVGTIVDPSAALPTGPPVPPALLSSWRVRAIPVTAANGASRALGEAPVATRDRLGRLVTGRRPPPVQSSPRNPHRFTGTASVPRVPQPRLPHNDATKWQQAPARWEFYFAR